MIKVKFWNGKEVEVDTSDHLTAVQSVLSKTFEGEVDTSSGSEKKKFIVYFITSKTGVKSQVIQEWVLTELKPVAPQIFTKNVNLLRGRKEDEVID